MQVLLKKEGLFGFDETKYTKIASDVFDTMVSGAFGEQKERRDKVEAEMFYFKNMRDYDDYNFNHNEDNTLFDNTKSVYVSQKGEIFVFKRPEIANSVTITNNNKERIDVTTNTKEDTSKKS